jgi:hypothetical protein
LTDRLSFAVEGNMAISDFALHWSSFCFSRIVLSPPALYML